MGSFHRRKRWAAHAALLLVALTYGISYTFAQIVLSGYVPARAFVAIRVGGAWILFLGVNALFFRRWVPERQDWPRFVAAGLTGAVINMTLFLEGLSRTSAIHASLIMTTTPVIILILSAVWLRTRVTWRQVVGIIVAGAGVVGLILASKGLPGEGDWVGDLMVLINATSYAVYLIVITPMMKKYPAPLVIFWVFGAALPWVLALGWPQWPQIRWAAFTPLVWGALATVVLGTTFLAYLLNAWALRYVAPYVVGVYVYLQPVVATFSAVALGKDTLSGIKVVLGMVIIGGVILTNWPTRPPLSAAGASATPNRPG